MWYSCVRLFELFELKALFIAVYFIGSDIVSCVLGSRMLYCTQLREPECESIHH